LVTTVRTSLLEQVVLGGLLLISPLHNLLKFGTLYSERHTPRW
jgi:hypothetical protein